MDFLWLGESTTPGYGHWVFNVNIYPTRKARSMQCVYLTDTPQEMMYISFFLLDIVSIPLMIAALKNIDVKFFIIGNAYLNADTDDMLYFNDEKSFGPEA